MAKREDSTIPLLPDNTYHIYNRGINRGNIFFQERNYLFFLQQFQKYCSSYLDTFAYCLIPNHFHIAIRPKNEREIFRIVENTYQRLPKGFLNSLFSKNVDFDADVNNLSRIPVKLARESATWFVSNQIKIMLTSFSKSINIQEERCGSLFEKSFKRKLIESEKQFQYLIWYIHRNPVHHKLQSSPADYKYSSYRSFLSNKPSLLCREEVFEAFHGKDSFLQHHEQGLSLWKDMEAVNLEI